MSNVTVHYLRKDGTEGSAVIEADASGGFTWTVPADYDGIMGFTLPGGERTRVVGGGGGYGGGE
jgi:hypothetical protein